MKLKETDLTNEVIKGYNRGVQSLQNKPMSKKDITAVFNLTFGTITRHLVKGDTVPVPKFGQFEVRDRKAHKGHNPQTGESLTVAEHNAVHFKPSSPLKRIVNIDMNNDSDNNK